MELRYIIRRGAVFCSGIVKKYRSPRGFVAPVEERPPVWMAQELPRAAGLALLHSWLTDQVDGRLTRFQPVPQLYQDVADGRTASGKAGRTSGLPSAYRVYFYDRGGHRLAMSLSGDEGSAGPRLPIEADMPNGAALWIFQPVMSRSRRVAPTSSSVADAARRSPMPSRSQVPRTW